MQLIVLIIALLQTMIIHRLLHKKLEDQVRANAARSPPGSQSLLTPTHPHPFQTTHTCV